MKTFFSLVCALTFAFAARAQDEGRPFTRNYTPKEYDNAVQVLCIAEDSKGLMYFGCGGGVMEYDGKRWALIPTSNGTTPYSMDIDAKDVLYLGAVNEFGYLKASKKGKKEFVSLLGLLDEKERKCGAVYYTKIVGGKVYFHTTYAIFEHTPGGGIKTYKPSGKNKLTGMFAHQNDIYAQELNRGLLRLGKDSLETVSPFFFDKVYRTALSLAPDSLFLAGRTAGLFHHKVSTAAHSPFVIGDAGFLTDNDVYSAALMTDGAIMLGSTEKGVLAFSRDGKSLRAWNEANGLQNNKVYYILNAAQPKIWFGLTEGISNTDADLAWSVWDKAQGLKGSVTDLLRFENKLYATTTSGIFVIAGGKAEPVPGIPAGQCWSLMPYSPPGGGKQILLAGTSHGIFEIKDGQAVYIRKGGHCLKLYTSPGSPERVYGTDLPHFVSISHEKGKWIDEGPWEGVKGQIRGMREEAGGILWLGTANSGAIRVELDSATKPKKISTYTEKEGFPDLSDIAPYTLAGKTVFVTVKGLYAYDPATDRFAPYCGFDERLCGRDIFKIQEYGGGLWVQPNKNKTQDIGFLKPNGNKGFDWVYKPFRKLPQMEVSCLYQDSTGTLWIGGSEGLFRYEPEKDKKDYAAKFQTLIRKVGIGHDSTVYEGGFPDAPEAGINISEGLNGIGYEHNSIRFEFAAPFFDDEARTLYSYRLEGFDAGWSEWAKEHKKEYTNLKEGAYVFRVKAKNIYDTESETAAYKISVLPPWYRAWWAYMLYAAFSGLAVFAIVKLNTARLESAKEKLEATVLERTEEIRQQKEEIIAQTENLKAANTEIQEAYQDIQTLGEIGQKITSSLDFDSILEIIYTSVNDLMPAEIFGIGLYDSAKQEIEYRMSIEKGQRYKPYTRSMADKKQFPVWCIENKSEVFVNDVFEGNQKYLGIQAASETRKVELEDGSLSETPKSLIYLPLIMESKVIGIMTVQALAPNAYTTQQLTMLKTLGSYISIALENSKSYLMISEKNVQITDSIRYAQTIQQSMLPAGRQIGASFKEYFVFYQPKDIVSGDFYWFAHLQTDGRTFDFVAVVDCTGHGVPGAFMSMIGYSVLNEVVREKKTIEPEHILEQLDAGVRIALRQEEKANDDGMDLGLARIERLSDKTIVVSAGAKQSNYLYQNGAMEKIQGAKRSVGGLQLKQRDFAQEERSFSGTAVLYLFSDGFGDQNNAENKKYGSAGLVDFLQKNADLKCSEQSSLLVQEFASFKGNSKQKDDVTVMGIRLGE